MERVSVWILGDQLLRHHPALRAAEQGAPRAGLRVVLVESASRAARLPYQRKKLVLLFSAMRHYAAELRAEGCSVDILRAGSAVEGLRRHVAEWQPARLFTMAAAEYRGRLLQTDRLEALLGVPVSVLPNTQFLGGRFDPAPAGKKVIMETFYRAMRRHFGLLMDGDTPAGGRWNFDAENRRPMPRGGLSAPPPPTFTPDATTRAAMDEVAQMAHATGTVDGFDLAVTRAQAEAAFEEFLARRLANFGPYEDAMSSHDGVLFHSLLSPYMNLGLLDPLEMVQRAEVEYRAGRAPLASVEGFIRQIAGWREYIYWHYWRQMPGLLHANGWRAVRPLPRFYWDGATEMACLRTVIGRVLDTGYSHHIERLMLLCNFAMLAGIEPQAVHEWFLAAYVDAYEWVVAPNVIGMGLNADGGQTATKPYVASANYINKMSDHCAACRFRPDRRTGPDACPFNFLYWSFLVRHEAKLRANPRLGPAVLGLSRLGTDERAAVTAEADAFLAALEPYTR